MASYLSDEWFDQLEAVVVPAVSSSSSPSPPPSREVLVLQHVVTGAPGGEVCYHVRVDGDEAAVVRGPAADPDVTFAEDYATAAAIARGELGAPAALLAGRIRVGGDLAALIAHRDLLEVADPVPAAVRAATIY